MLDGLGFDGIVGVAAVACDAGALRGGPSQLADVIASASVVTMEARVDGM